MSSIYERSMLAWVIEFSKYDLYTIDERALTETVEP